MQKTRCFFTGIVIFALSSCISPMRDQNLVSGSNVQWGRFLNIAENAANGTLSIQVTDLPDEMKEFIGCRQFELVFQISEGGIDDGLSSRVYGVHRSTITMSHSNSCRVRSFDEYITSGYTDWEASVGVCGVHGPYTKTKRDFYCYGCSGCGAVKTESVSFHL